MQTIQIDTITEYEVDHNYQPLQISMEIRPPLYLASPWIHLDGILSYLCLRDALGEEYWSLPSDKVVDISNLDIPLMKTKDIYHASVSILDHPVLKKNTIYKRFTDKETYHLSKKQQQGKIRTNAGHYKDFMINLPLIVTNNVKWYCNGNKKEIKRLLKHLQYLGKKTSIGGGYIKKITITETEADYSFYKDGYILKQLPESIADIPVTPGSNWSRCTYKPPYWDNSQVALCRMPPNQLVGEENNA